MDHAATPPVDPEVAEAMSRVLHDTHGNPSSIYAEGRAARAAVDRARDEVAAAIEAEPSEIVFTSGGTEADNLALRGALKARRDERDGLVTTGIEHHAADAPEPKTSRGSWAWVWRCASRVSAGRPSRRARRACATGSSPACGHGFPMLS